MRVPVPVGAVLCVLMVVAPLAACAVVLLCLPPGVDQIPMHWDISGSIDRYGPPAELWIPAFIGAGCNLLIALCYLFCDKLYDMGLVHGVSKKNAPLVLLLCGVVCAVIFVGCIVFIGANAVS